MSNALNNLHKSQKKNIFHTMIENLRIRPFNDKKDLPDALKCFNEGFHHILWPFIKHADPSFHLDAIRMFHKMSPDSFVAEIDNEVHGILFGATPFKAWDILKATVFGLFYMFPKILFNSYKFNFLAYKHLIQCIYGFAPWIILQPHQWPTSEINLFTSRRKYRGRGMGRELMDTFFNAVKKNKQPGSLVCTDTALSYQFYEIYGFKVERQFKMKAYKHSIPDQSFKGLIYYYSLDKTDKNK